MEKKLLLLLTLVEVTYPHQIFTVTQILPVIVSSLRGKYTVCRPRLRLIAVETVITYVVVEFNLNCGVEKRTNGIVNELEAASGSFSFMKYLSVY